MTPIIPDPEHVGLLMKMWIEIKNTPHDLLIGIITLLTVFIKLLGRSTRQKIALDPHVKASQMNGCKKDIIQHVDERFDHLEGRIDELYSKR